MYKINDFTKIPKGNLIALIAQGTSMLSDYKASALFEFNGLEQNTSFCKIKALNQEFISASCYNTGYSHRFRLAYKNEAKLFS